MSSDAPKIVTIWWRAGTIARDLREAVQTLAGTFAQTRSSVVISYLEPRPGSRLAQSSDPLKILVEGAPDAGSVPPIDELRLFGADGGIHAVAESGQTRWMQWSLNPPEQPSQEWRAEEMESVDEYPLLLLNAAGSGRRFGLAHGVIKSTWPMFMVQEYRRRGELFCWKLTGADDGRTG